MSKITDFFFKNKSTRQTIVKNTLWQSIAQFLGRGIKAIIVIYAARSLGADGYGVFTYTIGFAAIFSILTDFGLATLVVREISRGDTPPKTIIASTFFFKLVLDFLSYGVLLLIGMHFVPIHESRALIPIVGLTLLFDSFISYGMAVVKATEKMEVEAGIILISYSVTVTLGIVSLLIWKTPFALACAYAIGSGSGVAMLGLYFRKYIPGLSKFFDFKVLKAILVDALPFAFLSVGGALLINMDTLMLGWLTSKEQVGYYSAALKPVQLLFVFPTLISIAILPALSRKAHKGEQSSILEKSLGVLHLISIPIVTGGFLMAGSIIHLLYGLEYAPSIAALKILIFVVFLNFPASITSYAIVAHNKQLKSVIYFMVANVINIILNLLLVPRLGILGSAIATLISQGITTVGFFIIAKKIQRFSTWPYVWRPMIASTVMALGIVGLQMTSVPDAITFIVAVAVYASMLLFMKDPIFKEMKETFAS